MLMLVFSQKADLGFLKWKSFFQKLDGTSHLEYNWSLIPTYSMFVVGFVLLCKYGNSYCGTRFQHTLISVTNPKSAYFNHSITDGHKLKQYCPDIDLLEYIYNCTFWNNTSYHWLKLQTYIICTHHLNNSSKSRDNVEIPRKLPHLSV